MAYVFHSLSLFSKFCRWLPERVSNALVGLLTLRLPSPIYATFHFFVCNFNCCHATKGLAASPTVCLICLRCLSADPVVSLAIRIKSLEDAATAVDVPSLLTKITQDGFRREKEIDKHEALRLAEQLASVAKVSRHEKASAYDVIACTLREKFRSA